MHQPLVITIFIGDIKNHQKWVAHHCYTHIRNVIFRTLFSGFHVSLEVFSSKVFHRLEEFPGGSIPAGCAVDHRGWRSLGVGWPRTIPVGDCLMWVKQCHKPSISRYPMYGNPDIWPWVIVQCETNLCWLMVCSGIILANIFNSHWGLS